LRAKRNKQWPTPEVNDKTVTIQITHARCALTDTKIQKDTGIHANRATATG